MQKSYAKEGDQEGQLQLDVWHDSFNSRLVNALCNVGL
jgi:hypothetical protein